VNSQEKIVGFAEVSIRSYAEGCRSTRVAYLEAWYVDTDFRRTGVGATLLRATEEWGRQSGCIEFASDADPENQASIQAHRALAFEDAGLVQCFRKDLD
jgi:aminoglycoside 6'-N-acetyltransferase I